MLNWQGCGRHEARMQEVFNLIFMHHPKLLDFLFEKTKPKLQFPSDQLLFEAGVFSSGEQILICLALDLWDGSGKVSLWDMIERLDDQTYYQVLVGLRHLRRNDPDGPEMRWRQPNLAY